MIRRLLVCVVTLLITAVTRTPISEEIPGVVLAATTMPVTNIRTTDKQLNYIGCYIDDENRKLRGQCTRSLTQMTPQMCIDICKSKSYVYAGIQAWTYCLCGNQTPLVIDERPEADCYAECPGDKSTKCGADWRNSIYKTGAVTGTPISEEIPGVVVAATTKPEQQNNRRTDKQLDYIGCYIDDENRKIQGQCTRYAQMTPQMCVDFCKSKSYVFAGIQAWTYCFCGNQTPLEFDKRPERDCNAVCAGDQSTKCGGPWRNSIYKTGAVKDAPVECQMSLTTVNNQHVCTNAVVFEEHFDSISQEKWRHVVQIQPKPDYQFVIYNSHPVNSFISNGKLVVKPTLISDEQVKYGDLHLTDCTVDICTNECGYKATSYNILPPVQTARLTTSNSFAFRYGKVEITAKLPLGDWLVPELYLEPKDDVCGLEYYSGRIRIAMSRGNRDLMAEGQDIGCQQLESGVIMGTGDNIKTHTVVRETDDCWYKNYHNYTLIWTPDNIVFTVDGEQPQALIPDGDRTLKDIAGFPPEVTPTWSTVSKIAPFDKDLYITLGLSAGGTRDFPDNSINSGKPKPWRNFEPKALLNFWKDQHSWKPTWQEETALLQVDYVKVTAL